MSARDIGLLTIAALGGLFFGAWQKSAAAGSWMVLLIIAIGDTK